MASALDRLATLERPPVLPGFERIQRSWEPEHERWSARILPGEYFVTRSDEAIATVLGSCISACVRDPVRRVGGMNHFMLPEDTTSGRSSWLDPQAGLATRYGSFAMESLINDLLKCGARKERLEVKLFGGGNILSALTDIGARNIEFARAFLRLERLAVSAEDVGDVFPRRVVYFPATGRVLVRRLKSLDRQQIVNAERQHLAQMSERPAGNDVELFD
ncbi:MAG: chemoreceptor glutamine deamidase CheD [Steroidobacteraceae bacterium]